MNQLILTRLRSGVIEPLKDIVKWDRYAIREEQGGGFIFGWIERDDGFYDFIVVNFQLSGGTLLLGYNTSSKKYSKEIIKRLGGKDDNYLECRSAGEIVMDETKLIRWQLKQTEETNKF